MSLKSVLIVFLFAGVGSANAQIGFGPEVGIGFSTIRFAPATYPILYTSDSKSAVVSGKVGGLIDVPLKRNTYFQTGTYLSEKGAERKFSFYENDPLNESVKKMLHFDYVDLP